MSNPRYLRDLPMSEQMFLWALRHVVCACEDNLPVCPLVDGFFKDAGLPKAVSLITAMLRTLGASTRQPILVNVPCGVDIMPDEQALLDAMHCTDRQSSGEWPVALRAKIERHALPVLTRRLRQVGHQFEALEAMRGRCTNRATRH